MTISTNSSNISTLFWRDEGRSKGDALRSAASRDIFFYADFVGALGLHCFALNEPEAGCTAAAWLDDFSPTVFVAYGVRVLELSFVGARLLV